MTDFLWVIVAFYKTLITPLTKPFTGILSLLIKINKNTLFRPLTAKTGVRFPVGSPSENGLTNKVKPFLHFLTYGDFMRFD